YDLLKLKISFITAYPKEGTEKLWFVGLSSAEWTWIKSSATYDFAIDTQRKGGETKNWPGEPRSCERNRLEIIFSPLPTCGAPHAEPIKWPRPVPSNIRPQ